MYGNDNGIGTLIQNAAPLVAALTNPMAEQQKKKNNIKQAFSTAGQAMQNANAVSGQPIKPTDAQLPANALPPIVPNTAEAHNLGQVNTSATPQDAYDAAIAQTNQQFDGQINDAQAREQQAHTTQSNDINELKSMQAPAYKPPETHGIVHNVGSRNTALGLGLLGLLVPSLRQGLGVAGQAYSAAHDKANQQKLDAYGQEFSAEQQQFKDKQGALEHAVTAEGAQDRNDQTLAGQLRRAKEQQLAMIEKARQQQVRMAGVDKRFEERMKWDKQKFGTLQNDTSKKLEISAQNLALRGEDVASLIHTRQQYVGLRAASLQLQRENAAFRQAHFNDRRGGAKNSGAMQSYREMASSQAKLITLTGRAESAIQRTTATLANPQLNLTPAQRASMQNQLNAEISGYAAIARTLPGVSKTVDSTFNHLYEAETDTGDFLNDPNAPPDTNAPATTPAPKPESTPAKKSSANTSAASTPTPKVGERIKNPANGKWYKVHTDGKAYLDE